VVDEDDLEEEMKQVYRKVTKVNMTNWDVGPYFVHLGNKGWSCSCIHFAMKGMTGKQCRHVKAVIEYNRSK